ncbi:JIP5 [Candida oxycetoniae]|uniref:WD repeat-containing protein JIP5 n=1 Tax=Candida oxycetoniae TaxID=497107 RepID=A0AAI9SY54_9ASCO|nr:JIP5 [Candida oxycetoniae]KAI3405270.2 JIP5 [Candida oxycetoniae]
MGKKRKSSSAGAAQALESSVAPILEINYTEPLFTVAAHPSKPILISGLATGHLYCNSYDGEKLQEIEQTNRAKQVKLQKQAYSSGKASHVVNKSVSQSKTKWWTTIENNTDIANDGIEVKTNWKTKRHKGSCRHAIFDPRVDKLGEFVYTCGTDNIIKKAATETGKVLSKVEVVADYYSEKDRLTKLCHSATHPFLLSGTEDGHILVYDSTNLALNKLKFKVEQAHDDSINHIMSMPAVSPYHYLTLGSTTLSHLDIRKGIITQSDDQEDELLSMSYTTSELCDNKNDTVLVSHGEGLITIWKNSKNKLMDQLSRIKVNKTASIDAIVPTMNTDNEEMANSVWCGDSEGFLHRVNYQRGKVVETRVHSSGHGKLSGVDEVGILDIDYDYRLVSAGLESLKIWSNRKGSEDDIDSDGEDTEESGEEDTGKSDEEDSRESGEEDTEKSDEEDSRESDKDNDSGSESNSSEIDGEDDKANLQENSPSLIKKHNISKYGLEEPVSKRPKIKQKKLSAKQLRNMQKHEHGIRKFEGL